MSARMNRAAEGFSVDRYNAARAYLYVLKPWWARFGNKFTLTPIHRPSLGGLDFGAIGTTDRNFRIYLDRDFVSRSPLEAIAGSIEFFYQMHAREIYTRLHDVSLEEWDKWASIAFSLEINGAIERENSNLTSEKIMRVLVRSRLFTEADAEKFGVLGPPSTRDVGGWFPSDLSLPSDLTAEEYFTILKSLNFSPEEPEQDLDVPSFDVDLAASGGSSDDEEYSPDADGGEGDDQDGEVTERESDGTGEGPEQDQEGNPGTEGLETDGLECDLGEDEAQEGGTQDSNPGTEGLEGASQDADFGVDEGQEGDAQGGEAQEEGQEGEGSDQGGERSDFVLDPDSLEALAGEGGEPVGIPQGGEDQEDQDLSPQGGDDREVGAPSDAQGVDADPEREKVTQPTVDLPNREDQDGPWNEDVAYSEQGEEVAITQDVLDEIARRFREKMSDEASQLWSSVAANPQDPLAEAALPPKHERSDGLAFASKGPLLETLEADIVAYHSSTKDLDDFVEIDESIVNVARKRRRAKGLSLEAVLSKELSGAVNGVKTSGAADMSFSVRNPNQSMFGPILMGLHDYSPRVAIVLDVSASMFVDDRSVRSISIFNEVTAKITARFSCDVTWIAVNDKVAAVGKSRFADIDVIRSLASRGGTNFGHVLHALASGKMTWEGKRIPKPDIVCVITDCGFVFPKRPPLRFVFVSVAPPKEAERFIPDKFFRPGELIFASDLVF